MLALGLACTLAVTPALSAGLKLPSALSVIEADAFAGTDLTGVTELTLPKVELTDENDAFAGLTGLRLVNDPGNISGIEALSIPWDNGNPILLVTGEESPGAAFALASGIDFKTPGTVYRALVIGNTYPNSSNSLQGPDRDAQSVASMLKGFGSTPFRTTVRYNLTRAQMLSAISATFAGAKSSDVSLFYYSGHGGYNTGALVGTDNGLLHPAQLRAALDAIPGRKIVLIDACYSGTHTDQMAGSYALRTNAEPSADSFCDSMIAAFAGSSTFSTRRSGTANPYYMIVSSSSA